MIIKILLISGTLAFGLLLLRQRATGTNLAVRRLVGVAVVVLGVIAIAFPTTTVWAAHLVGVGRGTDLLLYVFVMVFLFTTVACYQRIYGLERRITDLTRELALRGVDDARR